MKLEIKESCYRVELFWEKFYFSTNLMEKSYYLNLVNFELMKIYYLIANLEKYETNVVERSMKEFTSEELKNFDGVNGNLAYVAVNGIVYDVSTNSAWNNGEHFGVMAGNDVTVDFENCHGDDVILKNLKVVGKLIE